MNQAVTSKDDRELDALVAERVMGWEHRNDHWWREHWPDIHNTVSFAEVPHYSTDIASAMQVVEKLLDSGYEFDLMTETKDDKTRVVMCMRPDSEQFWATNTSLARAICEAALAALEATKNSES